MAKTAAQRQREAFLRAQARARETQQQQVNQAQQASPNPLNPPAGSVGAMQGVTPPTVPPPFDAALEQQRITAGMNVGLAGAEAGYQRGITAYDTGYDASGQRNAANPYSQAQLLEDSYKRSLLGAQNSYAAMGQYNSGAYGRAQGRENRLYAQGSDRLQRDTAQAYHGIGQSQLQTYATNSLGVSSEAFAALKRAIYGS